MVEFNLKVNSQHRLAYMPKIILDTLGTALTIAPNSRAAVLYPTGENLQMVISSLRILIQDLELRSKRGGEVDRNDQAV